MSLTMISVCNSERQIIIIQYVERSVTPHALFIYLSKDCKATQLPAGGKNRHFNTSEIAARKVSDLVIRNQIGM